MPLCDMCRSEAEVVAGGGSHGGERMQSDPPHGLDPGETCDECGVSSDGEADYDDLDEDQAFRVGVLAQLDRIATALEAIERVDVREDAPDGPTYGCRSCDAEVVGREAAENHAVDEHGAPDDGETWRAVMEQDDPVTVDDLGTDGGHTT